MTRLVVTMLLLAFTGATWAAGPPDAATWARFVKIEEASRINLRGIRLYQAGKLADATERFVEALKLREAMYPRARYPQGHPDLATSLNNLAALHKAQADYAKAEPLFRRALEMREGLHPKSSHPKGHPHLAQSLDNLAGLHLSQGDYAKAEPLYRRALEMREIGRASCRERV